MTLRQRALPSIFVALLGTATFLSGCGYALVGRSNNLPPDVRGVFVRPFENRTNRAQVEQFLTNAVATELVSRPGLTLVRTEGEADAEMAGSVRSFVANPLTFDNQGRATRYEISIGAVVEVRRTGGDKAVLWASDNFVVRESYDVDASAAGYFDREDPAIEQAARRFAEELVSSVLEGF